MCKFLIFKPFFFFFFTIKWNYKALVLHTFWSNSTLHPFNIKKHKSWRSMLVSRKMDSQETSQLTMRYACVIYLYWCGFFFVEPWLMLDEACSTLILESINWALGFFSHKSMGGYSPLVKSRKRSNIPWATLSLVKNAPSLIHLFPFLYVA